jgi:hypothetical protein
VREGEKNEKDERRERVSEMKVFFYFINIKGLVGRAGGYPPDKICEIRYPSENLKNKKILINICPNMACGRAIGSGGFVGRVGFNGFLSTPNGYHSFAKSAQNMPRSWFSKCDGGIFSSPVEGSYPDQNSLFNRD